MMHEQMMKHMSHMMGSAGAMVTSPVGKGSLLATTGLAAGRGLLLRNPLLLLAAGAAAGIAAGYLLHKYQKEVVGSLGKASGMGRDFVLHQKENLADLMAEAEERTSSPAADSSSTPSA